MKNTKKVKVGNITIGGNSPIIVQSMTNTPTSDVLKTVRQIKKLERAGCELVRVSVPDMKSVKALSKIKKRINIPIVADVHFNYLIALESIKNGADKIRINPGNMKRKEVKDVVKLAKDAGVAIRIGVNSGSLKELEGVKLIKDRAKIMVDKVGEYLKDFESLGFYNTIVSLKSSDVLTSLSAYKLFNKKYKYPLHIGITESGSLFSGSIKSSIGIGLLLNEGLGNTIRVSLSDDPVWEVRAGFLMLQGLGLRKKYPDIISCPTCARSSIDVIKLVAQTEKLLYSFDWSKDKTCSLKIAVMGCIVNGPGEAKEADLGICGAKDKVCLFKKGKIYKSIKSNQLKDVFIKEIEKQMK